MNGEPGGKRALEPQHAAPPAEAPPSGAAPASATVTLASGRRYELEATAAADRIVVRGRRGEVVLRIDITDAGPVLSFSSSSEGERSGGSRLFEALPHGGEGDGTLASPAHVVGAHARSGREAIAPPRTSRSELPAAPDEEIPVPRATPLPFIDRVTDAEPLRRDAVAYASLERARPRTSTRRPPARVGGSAFISDPPRSPLPPGPEPLDDLAGCAPSQRALPALKLEQYAMLCAESSTVAPAAFEQALLRHGVPDRALWQALDDSWQRRLTRDPILTLRWMELTARYREQLKRR